MAPRGKSKQTDTPTTKEGRAIRTWLREITHAQKRDDDYYHEGRDILEIYAADRDEGSKSETQSPFNILYSNTETLSPALYSNLPRPLVSRRFKDDDPLGKAAADAGQRMLSFLLDTNVEGYEDFGQAMDAAVLDALLPGRAVTNIKYKADIQEGAEAGDNPAAPSEAYVNFQLVCLESRSWNKVLFGFARKWSKVPWVAFEEEIDKPEAVKLFGKVMAAKLTFQTGGGQTKDDDNKDASDYEEHEKSEKKTTIVYQIWDKDGGKKVRYVSPQYVDTYLKEDDDPLELTGFFPCPEPLRFVSKSNDLRVTPLYKLYKTQAEELNELTRRIKNITKAIKARGIYDSGLGDDLGKMFEADDNELIPATDASSLATEKGLGNAIWYAPLSELIMTLDKLYGAREQCKQVIYEVTGISDILRGSTKASETFGAQELKAKFGSLRLSKLQKLVQKYARTLMRMMLETAATKFDEQAWAQMTGLPFTSTLEHQQLQAIAQAAKAQGQQLPPEIQQKLAAPSWGQVLGILRNDLMRAYKVDIETNSTLEPEAAEDQSQIQLLMTAIGQFLQGVGPMIEKGIMPFEVARSMLLTIARRFQFGREIEEDLLKMQAPKPEDNGDGAKVQQLTAQNQQLGAESTLKDQRAQLDALAQKLQGKEAAMNAQRQVQDLQLDGQKRDAQVKQLKADMKLEMDKIQLQAESDSFDLKVKQDKHVETASTSALSEIVRGVEILPKLLDEQSQAVAEAQQLIVTVGQENQALLQEIVRLLGPKTKTVERGLDGKIVAVHETVDAVQGTA